MTYQMELHREHVERQKRLWGRKPRPEGLRNIAATPRPVSPFAMPRWARLFRRPIEELDEYGNIVVEDFYVPQWKRITLEVCKARDIPFNEVISPRRDRATVIARHEAWYRLKKETTMSYPAIGRRFGNKDHTTILHGIKMHEKRMMEAQQQ